MDLPDEENCIGWGGGESIAFHARDALLKCVRDSNYIFSELSINKLKELASHENKRYARFASYILSEMLKHNKIPFLGDFEDCSKENQIVMRTKATCFSIFFKEKKLNISKAFEKNIVYHSLQNN